MPSVFDAATWSAFRNMASIGAQSLDRVEARGLRRRIVTEGHPDRGAETWTQRHDIEGHADRPARGRGRGRRHEEAKDQAGDATHRSQADRLDQEHDPKVAWHGSDGRPQADLATPFQYAH